MAATIAAAAEPRVANTHAELIIEGSSPQQDPGELEQTSHTARRALSLGPQSA